MREFLTRRELIAAMGALAGGGGVAVTATRRATAQADERWPQFGHDRTNAARVAAAGPERPATEQWTYETGGGVSSSPAVVDGTVYVGSADGYLYALSAADGTERWATETGGSVGSSPAVAGGTVYVGSLDNGVYALSTGDGSERWRYGTGGGVVSSPAVVDGTVYVGSRDGHLYALSAADGTEQWRYETGGEIWSSPAVADGTVYIGSRDGGVHAVATADGTGRWTYGTGDWVESPPAVVDGTVYAGSLDGSVYALGATDGSERWVFDAGGGIASSPAVADGTVFVGGEDSAVYALSAADGDERWRYGTDGRVFSSPAVAGGTVYVGSVDTAVYALSAADGTERWRYVTGEPVFSSPAVVEGVVYVGSGDDRVYALREASSSTRTGSEATETTDPSARGGQNALGSATPGDLVAADGIAQGLPSTALLATLLGAVGVGGGGFYALRKHRSDDGSSPAGSAADPPDAPPAADEGVSAPGRAIPETAPGVEIEVAGYDELTDLEHRYSDGGTAVYRASLTGVEGAPPVAVTEPLGTETLHRSTIERVASGIETWSKLDDHDHVQCVVGHGAEPYPWVATEYMDGGTLAERAGELDLPQALWTALCATNAVHHAHRRGVTHLALTPRSVVFRETPGEAWDWPKVGGWGLSALRSPGTSGTVSAYAAPEQGDGSAPVDDITDVYRLGAVCYELFTGRPPFEEGDDVPDWTNRGAPAPPSDVADAPTALDDVLLPALAPARDDRYDSVVYLRDELGDLFLGT